ncbi:MAG: amidohydrolase family protein [Salibacteraceae bacterium]
MTPLNGVYSPSHTIYAFTNAQLVVSSNQIIENGTLVIQDGKVLASGENVQVPVNAVVFDLKGKFIYPSFIELGSNYGLPKVAKRKSTPRPQFVADNNGSFYWNDAIHPQYDAVTHFEANKEEAKKLRNLGFGVTLSHQINGIMRGTGVVTSVGSSSSNKIIKAKGAAFHGFGKGNSSQVYPTSLMGSIALFRQAMYDAQWYENELNPKLNISLQAINDNAELPQIFDGRNYQSVLRVAEISKEFEIPFIVAGGGDEYKRVSEIKESGQSLILPLKFPEPYDVTDPLDAEYISLQKMKEWELAPTNLALMHENEIPFAVTSYADQKKFWANLRLSIQYGLPKEKALASLTEIPAKFIKMENELGTLESGKMANFIICSEDIFVGNGRILENWTQGERNIISSALTVNPSGNYNMNFGGVLYKLNIIESKKGFAISTTLGGTEETPQKGKITVENDLVNIQFEKGSAKKPGPIRMVGKVNFKGKIIDGKAQDGNGIWSEWTAIKQKEINHITYGDSVKMKEVAGQVFYPNMAFGDTMVATPKDYFIKNVTIWSCDSTGRFKGSVLVSNGKIEAVGKNISNPGGLEVVDGSGMHLTPGIVDEHSHIAIKRGVNEGGQNNTAEVRIGDVINPDDINIYRQLSGGVTSVQLLHGSANPIGGQAQIIKLRWGQGAEGLKLKSDAKSIKFALGENVKQSNSDRRNSIRFPQTRMGVEQVYVDAFNRAKVYQKEWSAFNGATKKQLKTKQTPRRDLELDALVEIMNDERYITCHSYIQSEITMLMNVADSMGFRINTFTHILEGYKVADKMKKHGAYASTFADWWAYKFEVNDAIPYNAAILTKQGVLTAINSDDAEMGRRLNQEAAKTIKYGGMTETEALNMVTINPAKMLHIDHRVGSITPGKDADLVLWSGNPLSVYSHPEMVWIDGAVYYSKQKDLELQKRNLAERQRLIKAMMEAKNSGNPTQKVQHQKQHLYHCDSYEEECEF